MFGSFKIGSVLGITVRVHWMFVALIALLLLFPVEFAGPMGRLGLLVGLAVLFGVVFLHELGHSLVARRFGIRIFDITFWPLGGMARMSEIPETPRVEMLIAVAGPAVNFVLALLAAPLAVWAAVTAGEAGSGTAIDLVARLSGWFVGTNLALGVFNLLPAFPMDGGRILRAFLGRTRDWVAATEQAVKVGRLFAVLMILVGVFFSRQLMILPLIGLFVWFAGARELWAVRLRHGRMPFGPMAGQPVGTPGFNGRAEAPPPQGTPAGMSQREIERLERFSGSLRQFRADRD